MSNLLRISEATSLGLHTMVLLAANEGRRISAREVAELLDVSEAHLSKVMQRLGRHGLVTSIRGPKGGFLLARPGSEITLMEVFEAIEGPLNTGQCLLGKPICDPRNCILGSLLHDVNVQVQTYLAGTRLSDLTKAYKDIDVDDLDA